MRQYNFKKTVRLTVKDIPQLVGVAAFFEQIRGLESIHVEDEAFIEVIARTQSETLKHLHIEHTGRILRGMWGRTQRGEDSDSSCTSLDNEVIISEHFNVCVYSVVLT
jgi:hypothetical protein